VLDEVTEGFTLDVVGDEENQEETLSIDKLAATDSNIAPVIKLVDTTIFNALERRASDISHRTARWRKCHQVSALTACCITPCSHRQGLAFDHHFAH